MRQLEFFAYHGTDTLSSKKIVESQSFIEGKGRHDHWLGVGSYFFREDDLQAHLWAKYKVRHMKSGNPSVLEVKFRAPSDKVLHLDTRRGIEILSEFIAELDANNIIVAPKDGETITHRIFSMISRDEAWAIIKTFPVKSNFDKDNGLKKLNFTHNGVQISYGVQGTQVCVRNNSAIVKESIRILPPENEQTAKVTKSITKGPIFSEAFNRS